MHHLRAEAKLEVLESVVTFRSFSKAVDVLYLCADD